MQYMGTIVGAAIGYFAPSILPSLGPLSETMVQTLAGAGAGYWFYDRNGMATVSS